MNSVTVLGAGLAGCEAAWQLAERGVRVTLIDMKPESMSPAHTNKSFAELVCSNSLRGAALHTAPGLLKEELRRLGSLLIECADATAVPAGGALAVDRHDFSALVTKRIMGHQNITFQCRRIDLVPDGDVIVATGPLTDGALARHIASLTGGQPLHFFDAAAPIISADSIDMGFAYFGARYDRGTPDYINCPMDKQQYIDFVTQLGQAHQAEVHGFEDQSVFEGCMPVEVMARRGQDALRYGPLKPVGLRDPVTGAGAYAVVQLRSENAEKTMYNLVGFQTHLKVGEQKRVFSMIPALHSAEFLRYGVMHRNSYIDSPGKLDRFYRLIGRENIMFAGQMTGVEGYIESGASGLCAGVNMARTLSGSSPVDFPRETAIGALGFHIAHYQGGSFQPMNINFGLLTPLGRRVKDKRDRYTLISERALECIDGLKGNILEDRL